jgi:FKBP-type peptidyl-prolyl cis-trans isomerase
MVIRGDLPALALAAFPWCNRTIHNNDNHSFEGDPMKLRWLVLLAITGLAMAACNQKATIKTPLDKSSYAVGAEFAKNLKRQGGDLNRMLVLQGINDVLKGDKLLLSDEEMRTVISTYQAVLRRKQMQNMKQSGEDNKKAGEAFLAANKQKEGVVVLPSGLQYKVIKMGEGKKPTEDDAVECNYRGTLIDGTEFDSSYKAGKPAVLQVKRVIAGWKEALQLMPVGSKWQLVIPSELAYGPRGAGKDIGPNATLIFELEVLGIK